MKTLDAFALINGIDQTLNALKQQSQQISSLEKQINHIISLDGALKGEADKPSAPFIQNAIFPSCNSFRLSLRNIALH